MKKILLAFFITSLSVNLFAMEEYISLPSSDILQTRLNSKGFLHFVEQTHIHQNLGGKKQSPFGVNNAIVLALLDYKKQFDNDSRIIERQLMEIILEDYPQAMVQIIIPSAKELEENAKSNGYVDNFGILSNYVHWEKNAQCSLYDCIEYLEKCPIFQMQNELISAIQKQSIHPMTNFPLNAQILQERLRNKGFAHLLKQTAGMGFVSDEAMTFKKIKTTIQMALYEYKEYLRKHTDMMQNELLETILQDYPQAIQMVKNEFKTKK